METATYVNEREREDETLLGKRLFSRSKSNKHPCSLALARPASLVRLQLIVAGHVKRSPILDLFESARETQEILRHPHTHLGRGREAENKGAGERDRSRLCTLLRKRGGRLQVVGREEQERERAE